MAQRYLCSLCLADPRGHKRGTGGRWRSRIQPGANPTYYCSDLWGNAGGNFGGYLQNPIGINGNISLDPQFCDADAGDYRVLPSSPCLPENHPGGCGPIGALGACPVVPLMLDLYPAYYLHGSWDQLLCPFGPQVPQGRYRLWVGYWSECCPGYLSVETWFSIGLDPVAPATWGAIKALFE